MRRALIVDYDSSLLELHRAVLERNGYIVHCAADASSGAAMVLRLHPHLVVLNDILPDVPGGVLCACIKNDPRFRDTRVLLVSAGDAVDRASYVSSTGADGALRIPYLPGELLAAIERILAPSLIFTV